MPLLLLRHYRQEVSFGVVQRAQHQVPGTDSVALVSEPLGAPVSTDAELEDPLQQRQGWTAAFRDDPWLDRVRRQYFFGPQTERNPLSEAIGSSEHADFLVKQCVRIEVAAGEIIARQGDPADAMHFILDGRISILVNTGDNQVRSQPRPLYDSRRDGSHHATTAQRDNPGRKAKRALCAKSRCL
jgi:hypothetical protein